MSEDGVRQRSPLQRPEPTLWELAKFKPRGGIPDRVANTSWWHFLAAWLNTILCALYIAGTVDGILHHHIESLKLSPGAWAAVRDGSSVSLPKYIGLTVGFAAVSAAWGIYATFGNPWTRSAFQLYVGIKVTKCVFAYFGNPAGDPWLPIAFRWQLQGPCSFCTCDST